MAEQLRRRRGTVARVRPSAPRARRISTSPRRSGVARREPDPGWSAPRTPEAPVGRWRRSAVTPARRCDPSQRCPRRRGAPRAVATHPAGTAKPSIAITVSHRPGRAGRSRRRRTSPRAGRLRPFYRCCAVDRRAHASRTGATRAAARAAARAQPVALRRSTRHASDATLPRDVARRQAGPHAPRRSSPAICASPSAACRRSAARACCIAPEARAVDHAVLAAVDHGVAARCSPPLSVAANATAPRMLSPPARGRRLPLLDRAAHVVAVVSVLRRTRTICA